MKKIVIFLFLMSLKFSSVSQMENFLVHHAGLGDSYANDMIFTSDSSYLLTGATYRFHGNDEVYLLKYDVDGNFVWFKSTGLNDNAQGRVVIETSQGNYLVGTQSSGPCGITMFDQQGNILWQKIFGVLYNTMYVSTALEINDNFYFFGVMYDSTNFNKTFLYKTNQNGDSLMFLTDLPFHAGSRKNSVVKYGNDKFLICGYEMDSTLTNRFTSITVIDTAGSVILQHSYPFFPDAVGHSILVSPYSEFIILTEAWPAVHFFKTDTLGNIIWQQNPSIANNYTLNLLDNSNILIVQDQVISLYDPGGQLIDAYLIPIPGYLCNTSILNDKITIAGSGSFMSSQAAFLMQIADTSSFVNIADLEKDRITVFPNPFTGSLSLKGLSGSNADHVLINNLLGEVAYDSELNANSDQLNLEFLPEGFYVLTILNDKRVLTSKKIIKL